jgi:hypothetical protein
MMSTYELVIAFLSMNSTTSSEITIRPKKVLLNDVDSEVNAATNEADL